MASAIRSMAAAFAEEGIDPEAAIAIMRDCLEALADETAEAKPYATRSIADYRKAASLVADLSNSIPF